MHKKINQKRRDNFLFFGVLAIALAFSFLLFQNAAFGQSDSSDSSSSSSTTTDNTDAIAKTQKSISDLQKKIDSQQKQEADLQQNLAQIQQNVNVSQSDIDRTQAMIQQTEDSITEKENEMQELDSNVQFQTEALKSLIQEAYYTKQEPLVDIVLQQDNFSAAWGKIDDVINMDQKITDLIDGINQAKDGIESDRQNLVQSKSDHEQLLVLKSAQQQTLLSQKDQTQNQIADTEATIQDLQDKLSQLQSNLSGFLGKSYNASDIESAAKYASNATGVRKDFLMGMLTVESDLGQFTGGCNYKTSRMTSYRVTLFRGICKDLGYDYTKEKVSCAPKSYAGTGGAMGVAQFMSDTWVNYESSIASNTGHNPPDPWSLTDGVMAMALKLAKGGASSKSGECDAAKLYLSGTTSSKYQWYCNEAEYWANNYESKLDNGN